MEGTSIPLCRISLLHKGIFVAWREPEERKTATALAGQKMKGILQMDLRGTVILCFRSVVYS